MNEDKKTDSWRDLFPRRPPGALECPICREGYRYLYHLADDDRTTILICEECTLRWMRREDGKWDYASNQALEGKFGRPITELLNGEGSGWA